MVTGRFDWEAAPPTADGNLLDSLEVAHIIPYAWNKFDPHKPLEVRLDSYKFIEYPCLLIIYTLP
jgi:hypothetical protein